MSTAKTRAKQWRDTLDRFKAEASALHAAYVVDNPTAMRVLSVWPHQVLDIRTPATTAPKNRNKAWQWLWVVCDFDPNAVATAAGMHPDAATKILAALIGSRAIYPDGTLCPHAEQVVKLHLAARLRAKRPREKKKP